MVPTKAFQLSDFFSFFQVLLSSLRFSQVLLSSNPVVPGKCFQPGGSIMFRLYHVLPCSNNPTRTHSSKNKFEFHFIHWRYSGIKGLCCTSLTSVSGSDRIPLPYQFLVTLLVDWHMVLLLCVLSKSVTTAV